MKNKADLKQNMAHLESRASFPGRCEQPLLRLESRCCDILLKPTEVVHHITPVGHEWRNIRHLTNARRLDNGVVWPDVRGTMVVCICSKPVVMVSISTMAEMRAKSNEPLSGGGEGKAGKASFPSSLPLGSVTLMASLSAWPSHTQWTLFRNSLSPRYNPVLRRHLQISRKRVEVVGEGWLTGMEGG